jgi:DNA-binding response OmpR family regulator
MLRVSQPDRRSLRSGDLLVDLTRKVVRRGQLVLSLTTNEWAILIALASRGGDTVAFQELAGIVAGEPADFHPSLLWPTIARMRRVLEEEPDAPQIIVGDPEQGLRLGIDVTTEE